MQTRPVNATPRAPALYTTPLLRELRRTIGRNLHCLRARKKIPLRKMAAATGIAEWMIDYYELGKGEITFEHALKSPARWKSGWRICCVTARRRRE